MTRPVVPSLAAGSRLVLDEAALREWGKHFGQAAEPPLVVTLSGELGAGKTTLAQAICEGYGVTDAVTSPTYALVQQYSAPRSAVFHIDLYRLDSVAQLTNIGWDEVLNGDALVIVEWPERAAGRLPAHVPIALEYEPGDAARRILLAG
ncbi:MAG TPA: tRNA (adenosine(37)-N6)-threonylcarbamoyltransferase complex ATPase subunit type 1 TsaE [Gemmatimonadaceae bacterium]|nr:tRNA (adenosine(37)-N6)-threonylcarbamoyltransferase complex ATPase subunit type 1 TsaE [Gemmatimonadaceae bacterium]